MTPNTDDMRAVIHATAGPGAVGSVAGASPGRAVSRRAVAQGALWATPVVVAAGVAPTAVASPVACGTPTQPVYGTSGTVFSGMTGGGVSISTASTWYSSANVALAGNYQSTSTANGLLSDTNRGNFDAIFGSSAIYMAVSNKLNNALNTPADAAYQLFTITFSQPVYGLTFYISDIDQVKIGAAPGYQDQVSFTSSPSTSPTVTALPYMSGASTSYVSNVSGVWQPNTTMSGYGTETAAGVVTPSEWSSVYDATTDYGRTGDNGNIKVEYPTTTGVSSVTIRYASAAGMTDSQVIFLSPLSYYTTACG